MSAFRRALGSDIDRLISLRRDFCREDGHDFDEESSRRIFAEVIGNSALGEIHLALTQGVVGYAFFTNTYSIEFNGRDALLDEIYIDPAHRAKGLGGRLIEAVISRVRELGGSYLHLEAMDDNEKVHPYYKSKGFLCRKSKHYVMPLRPGLPTTV